MTAMLRCAAAILSSVAMATDLAALKAALIEPFDDGDLRLEQLAEPHREELRAACAADAEIWAIYPNDWLGQFDACFDAVLRNDGRCPFTVIHNGRVIGMSGYLNFALDRQAVEIGNTYIEPAARGTGLNGRVKQLLLDRAFGLGLRRVEFRVDARNGRSQAAVLKLGATREGLLRAERITWTGHVRDTAVFSLLADEWSARA
jgi:RimJ/RimL family protein N-acetyltransferase